jgi:hypothetical protein
MSDINRVLFNLHQYLGPHIKLYKSTRANKKFMIQRPDTGQFVHFGDSRYEDYTLHRDNERRYRYLKRANAIRGNWRNDPYSTNNLAINLLWQ